MGRPGRKRFFRRPALRSWPSFAALVLVVTVAFFAIKGIAASPPRTVRADVSARDRLAPFAGGLLQLRNDTLVLHKPNGTQKDFADAFPATNLIANARFAACWDSSRFIVFDTNGAVVLTRDYSTGNTEMAEVISVSLGQQKIGLYNVSVAGSARIIQFNSEGRPASYGAQLEDFDNQTVLDFGFYGNPSNMWVTVLDTNNETHTTHVRLYSQQTNIGHITVYGEVVLTVAPKQNAVMVVGTSHCYVYDNKGELQSEESIHGWTPIGVGGQDAAPRLLLHPSAPEGASSPRPLQTLWIYTPGEPGIYIDLPPEATLAAVGEKQFYVVSGKQIRGYRYNGQPGRTVNLDFAPTKLTVVSPRQAVASDGNDVYFISLP